MGSDRRFVGGLALRTLLLAAALCLAVWSILTPGLGAARLVALLLVAAAGAALWRHVDRTNAELARFVEAVRFGDLQARFSRPGAGSGFDRLGATLDAGIAALRAERARLADAARFHEALVDDVPVALLTVDADGVVTPVNKVARKLFNRHAGVRVGDYAGYGAGLPAALAELPPGESRTLLLDLGVGPQRALIRAAIVGRTGGSVRVVAVQVIQQSLNAVEVAAQSGLVRVLTHEIMNSLTPVTSLAHTAVELVAAADSGDDPAIADARAAVETLARRADGIMHFVESYREITRPPRVQRRMFAAGPYVAELARLFRADPRRAAVALAVSVEPETHLIDADPDLLAQVIINLLRNAADAAEAAAPLPAVTLTFAGLRSGHTRIEVADNGAGVPEAIRGDIFLPFMTTKPGGSGVGLSFARQVVLGHDGTIDVLDGQGGGALFRIVI